MINEYVYLFNTFFIIANPIEVVLPFNGKQELVHLDNTKVSFDHIR